MALKLRRPTWTTFQAAVPPVGSVDVTTSPLSVTATHSEALGHETARRPQALFTWAVFQTAAPPPGFEGPAKGLSEGLVEVTTLPAASVATHSATPGHEMPRR